MSLSIHPNRGGNLAETMQGLLFYFSENAERGSMSRQSNPF